MRRWRTMTAGLTGIVLGAGLALGGATTASAATAGHWGAFALSGTSRAYTGTMTLPGFPKTTFTSNSRQSAPISGASTWQGPNTGPGAVYGSSRGFSYLNQRPLADQPRPASASTTTYTFAGGTPGAGGWSFVLGDVDADQATVSATLPGGAPASVAQLGFQSSYNSCSSVTAGGWSCSPDPGGVPAGQDTPTWDPATGVLTGNDAANDTAGATAWFTPTVPLATLTITYQQRSGLPVYQTWFANQTSSLSGVATIDGTPLPDTVVTVTAPNGTEYTTTTDDSGAYTFDALTQADGYRVAIATPDNATEQTAPGTVSLRADVTNADFAFVTPPGTVAVTGTVVDTTGAPVADAAVTITDQATGATLAETVTDADGAYAAPGLPAATAVVATVAGATPVTATTGADGADPVVIAPIVVQAATLSTISGRVTLDGAASADRVLVELVQDGTVVATTDAAADGTYAFRVQPGTYTVRTTAPADGATGPTEVAVTTTADGTTTADFPFVTPVPTTASQAGTVTSSAGTPLAGTTVTATPVDVTSGVEVTATTGADGTYDLTGLTPGTPYRVSVAGTTPQDVTTEASGAAPTPLDFVVPVPTVDQPGTVTDAVGAAAADVPVVATPTEDGAGDAVTTTTTAADGTFDLTGLRPSTSYSVVAGSGDQASEPQVVVTPASGSGTPLSITLAAVTPTPSTPPTPGGGTGGGGTGAGGTGAGTVGGGTTPGSSSGGSTSGSLAFTGAEIAPAAIAAGILVLLGAGLLTFRAARNRRRTEHLQD
ncbi:carboxypeptidase regulatory-like domain-containing protein [Curtobacterium sp. VKM Ac-2865]|uniref:carboxypeptidase-like regulatory domain-containing protein n=1 Tax=Curtobacterium sp. VKM Ac-2865 TaxID=2783817 RepID=UPI001889C931|nr:carboxypeptidase-like regulatory domain-containing protein [Curtobacterium sp. VKM Ac-2865]MBF4581514.1 carboxypeptidase regulatory-like domain-containing protein [Curtobacterium sp. VKM Ac-2865]